MENNENIDTQTEESPQEVNDQSQSMNPFVLGAVIVVIALVSGVFLLVKRSDNSSVAQIPEPTVNTAISENPPINTNDVAGIEDTSLSDEINVEAGSFYFNPAQITVKKGQEVKIVINAVDMMHDFVIDELGVKIPLTKAGEKNEVVFTPTKIGQFTYYCSVGQHRKNGQEGILIVKE